VAGSERCRPCEQLEDTPHLQFWPLRPLSPQAVWTSTSAFSEQRYLPVAGLNFMSWHSGFAVAPVGDAAEDVH
jgi:hypothetical protein